MSSLGLALSGGGFRATLYHLGVIRYLRDNGSLPLVADIASVSGGSVLAAHLVLNWDRYTGSDADFAEVAAEIVRFVQFDVRNRIVRRLPLLFPLRLVGKVTGWRASGFTPNALLEGYYRRFLYGDRRLFELPETPALHILSTNVSDGVMAVFDGTLTLPGIAGFVLTIGAAVDTATASTAMMLTRRSSDAVAIMGTRRTRAAHRPQRMNCITTWSRRNCLEKSWAGSPNL